MDRRLADSPPMAHRIAALAFDGLAPFELAVVVEVFGLRRPELDVEDWYELVVCTPTPGRLQMVGGIVLSRALKEPERAEFLAQCRAFLRDALGDADV